MATIIVPLPSIVRPCPQGYAGAGGDRPDGKHRSAGKCPEPHPLRREPEDENRHAHGRDLDLCKLLEVNDSATNMVHAVANLELVLKDKLEFISNNLYYPSADAAAQ